MKRYDIVIFVVLGISLPFAEIMAAGSFRISPVFQEINLEGEVSEEFVVTVTNETSAISTFRLSVLDFGSLDESGGVAFLGAPSELEKKYALASWMRPETDTLTLLPESSADVKVTIENRQDLSPGGHYAALIFSNAENSIAGAETNNRIAVNQIFSVLVFVKKKGGEVYGLELVEKKWSKNLLSYDEKVQLRFKNTGNVHLVPRGRITVTDPLGRIIALGIVNEESALILPETFRIYPVKLLSQAVAFIPGRYHLSLATRYDGLEEFTVMDETFDFFPPLAILSILPVIVGTGWYVARKRKNTGERASDSGTV